MNTNHDDKHGMRSRANQLIGILKEQRVVEKWREYCHYWTITIAARSSHFPKLLIGKTSKKVRQSTFTLVRITYRWGYCHYWTITNSAKLSQFSKRSDWQDNKKVKQPTLTLVRIALRWEYCHYWTTTIGAKLSQFSKSSDWQDYKKVG